MKSEEPKLNKLNYSQIDLNKKYNIKFKDKILGFGWSHNFNNKGRGVKVRIRFYILKHLYQKKS